MFYRVLRTITYFKLIENKHKMKLIPKYNLLHSSIFMKTVLEINILKAKMVMLSLGLEAREPH